MLSFTVYNNKQSSKWVTFIHGAGGSSSIWFRQIRSFKEEFNVLLIDLGGHGKSKSRFSKRSKQGYTFNIVTEDIVEVLEHLKIKSSHFVGVSLGTIIIREVAEKNPISDNATVGYYYWRKGSDFVKYAESYGAKGYRVNSSQEFKEIIEKCMAADGVHLIDCPVDYSENDEILNHRIKEMSSKL